jgi:hypothetical protein
VYFLSLCFYQWLASNLVIYRGARVVRVFSLLLDRNQRQTLSAKVRVLFVEKRKEKLHGVMQWDSETGGPLSQVGN